MELKHTAPQTRVLLLLCVFGCPFVQRTLAELNGSVSSVEDDRGHVAGTMSATLRLGSTIYEIKDPNGTLVREYVSPDGRVFAIAWEGHFVPEMEHFLGALFQQYSTAVHAEHAKHGWRQPLNIHSPTLTFEAGGHMGWYYGRAYVQSNLPNGFPSEEIH
jgi:Protein of unknown function (DUF2844)